jgi:hypothetical protein
MEKTVLLFDYVIGQVMEIPINVELKYINYKREDYIDRKDIIFGRDFIEGYKVYFVKTVDNSTVTRLTLENDVKRYIEKVLDNN